MKILTENQYSDSLDNSFLDDPNLKSLLFNENKKEDAIIKTQILSKSKFRFKVQNHCGHLKIGPHTYFVIPKMGKDFLKTMLKSFNRTFFSVYQNDLAQDESRVFFDELIAHLFIGTFNRTLSGKIRLGYIDKNITTYKSSGKIDIKNSQEFFVYSTKPPRWTRSDWSRDTDSNKALRTLFLNLSQNLDVCSKTKNNLAGIALEISDQNYEGHLDYRKLLSTLDRTHENYKPLLELAILLNMKGNITAGKFKSFSLLFPTWLLFEGACKMEISNLATNHIVNIEDTFEIKASKDSNNVLKPDIVFKDKDGKVVKIGDCKYVINNECKLKRDHLFQLNTYMDGYGLSSSFVLCPSHSFKSKKYQLNWGNEITIFSIPTCSHSEFVLSLQKVILDLQNTSAAISA